MIGIGDFSGIEIVGKSGGKRLRWLIIIVGIIVMQEEKEFLPVVFFQPFEGETVNSEIQLREQKEEEKPVRSLNDVEIKKLLKATEPYPSMKIRVLLALATGLRRGDIDSLKICDIDFEKNSISTKSRKTKKSMASRPVSGEIMTELSKYVCGVDVGQEKLFKTKFNHRKWRKVCKKAGLVDLKFHDLRRTFCSLLAQNGVSTAVTQRLLEHSSPNLTNRVYTNVDPVLRSAVEQSPVGEWL